MLIPRPFEEKFRSIFGKNYEKLMSISRNDIRHSIRVNTLKISKVELADRLKKKGWLLDQILWYDNGFFVKTEDNKSKTLEYYLGYYYIQESASMVPSIVLDPQENERVLDISAAPGSKTTQTAMMMNNRGLIVANDLDRNRLEALKFNLQKYGVTNTVVTNSDGRFLWQDGIKFDKILLDAPCSGSGTFVTNQNVFESWNLSKVNELSRLQKQLLESASKCLDENGEIVYSTCSLDPEENEEVIDFAVGKLGLTTEKIELNGIKYDRSLKSFNRDYLPEVRHAIRIHPFDNFTEGFFICKLKKC